MNLYVRFSDDRSPAVLSCEKFKCYEGPAVTVRFENGETETFPDLIIDIDGKESVCGVLDFEVV